MRDTIVSQLKAMKQEQNSCTPDPTWKAKSKDRLFLHIEHTREKNVTSTFTESAAGLFQLFMPVRLMQTGRTVASVALISLLGIGGWIATVSASFNSVPGNVLYNVKLATEKVQIVVSEVTGEKQKTAKLHTEFAARRAVEVKKVIDENKEPEQAKVAIDLLTQSITDATEAVQEVDTKEFIGTDVLEPTKTLLEETDQIVQSLDESIAALQEDSVELLDNIIEAQGDLAESQLDTLQNIVDKQLDGDVAEESEKDVTTIVKDVLESLNERAEETEELTRELQENAEEDVSSEVTIEFEEVTTEVEETEVTSSTEGVITEAVSEADVVNTSTEQMPEPTQLPIDSEDSINTDDVAAATAVTESYADAKDLVESGRLTEAIEKAQQASEAGTEAKQTVEKVANAVEEDTKNTEEEDEILSEETTNLEEPPIEPLLEEPEVDTITTTTVVESEA